MADEGQEAAGVDAPAAAPKKPKDHLAKKDKPKPKVVRTESGFSITHLGLQLEIPIEALNDFELLRDLGRFQDPAVSESAKMSGIPSIFDRFFGPAQQGEVLNLLRDKATGRVTVQAASGFLFEVFGALNPES